MKPAAGHRSAVSRLRAALGLVPFTVYVVAFLGAPAVAVVVGAFSSPAGKPTLYNLRHASSGVYRRGFETSLELAVITAILAGIIGPLFAYAVHTSRAKLLRRLVATASGVFANFGGVPLAFLFIASLGTSGVATHWLADIGLNPYDHGFDLYTLSGIVVVYLYFQIPLMVLVTTPAFEGLRPAWREAASNLGGGSWAYWRHVGGPVLAPSVLGSVLLLFGFGLSAFATADALTSGSVALTPIQIGSFLNGNVIAGQQNVGMALGLGLIVIVGVVMAFYMLLARRASRWSQ